MRGVPRARRAICSSAGLVVSMLQHLGRHAAARRSRSSGDQKSGGAECRSASAAGGSSRPARVVAPISVKGLSGRLIVGVHAGIDHEIHLELLHGRVDVLLDGRREAVDLVDEQHVAAPGGW